MVNKQLGPRHSHKSDSQGPLSFSSFTFYSSPPLLAEPHLLPLLSLPFIPPLSTLPPSRRPLFRIILSPPPSNIFALPPFLIPNFPLPQTSSPLSLPLPAPSPFHSSSANPLSLSLPACVSPSHYPPPPPHLVFHPHSPFQSSFSNSLRLIFTSLPLPPPPMINIFSLSFSSPPSKRHLLLPLFPPLIDLHLPVVPNLLDASPLFTSFLSLSPPLLPPLSPVSFSLSNALPSLPLSHSSPISLYHPPPISRSLPPLIFF